MELRKVLKRPLLAFILTLFFVYLWQIIIHSAIAIYYGVKLNDPTLGTEKMNELFNSSWGLSFFTNSIMELIVLFIAFIFIKKEYGKYRNKDVGLCLHNNSLILFLSGFLISSIILLITFSFALLLNNSKIEYFSLNEFGFAQFAFSFIIAFLFMLFPSICEEILFRGYIQNKLLQSNKIALSLIITTLLFTIIHVGPYGLSIFAYIEAILLGLLLGYLYYKTKSLYISIGVHFGWNFISVLVSFNDKSLLNVKPIIKFEQLHNSYLFDIVIIICVMISLILSFLYFKKIKTSK